MRAAAIEMFDRLLETPRSAPLAVVRLLLGAVFFAHGAQKALGWFGGAGFAATMGFFEHSGIPAVFALLAILAEFAGGLGLLLGLLGRVAAFGICVNMLVAVATVHARNGFFMNWAGRKQGEGFEYHLLAIGMAVAVMIGGSGALSLDRLLSRRPVAPAKEIR